MVYAACVQGVIWRAMWSCHGRAFLLAGLLKLVHDCVMFLGPVILQVGWLGGWEGGMGGGWGRWRVCGAC